MENSRSQVAGPRDKVQHPTANAKPSFHLQPRGGWVNDPNGVHYDAKTKLYHMFYQHHRTSSQWSWGLCWGHAVSEDLVHWSHLPPALDPTPEGPDAGGVWSGCAFPTDEGTVLLHTAVRKRDDTPKASWPPEALDLGNEIFESQQFAVAQPGTDPLLRDWTKGKEALLPLPPQGNLTGWRDPFLIGRPGDGLHDKYTIIIGAGYKDPKRGAAMVYTSDSPTSGWKYEGDLCQGDGTTGAVWECPVFQPVRSHPQRPKTPGPDPHMLVVCPDHSHYTPVYFLGNYDPKAKRFYMSTASGPYPLDLGGGPQGCTFYAPNVLTNDPHGRLVMWGWCQESGRPGKTKAYNYGSCLSLPRLIWRHPHVPGMLWQEPLPSLSRLRFSTWCLIQSNSGSNTKWARIDRYSSSNGDNEAEEAKRVNGGSSNGTKAAINVVADSSFHDGAAAAGHQGMPGTSKVALVPGQPLPLPEELGSYPHMELELTLEPPASLRDGTVAKTGVIIHSSQRVPKKVHEASGRNGAALLYDWRHARLEVVFSDGLEDLETLCSAPAATYDAMNSTSRVYASSEQADAGETLLHGHKAPAGSPVLLHEALHKMEGDLDAEHRPLDVRGCHSVGGQLILWDNMNVNNNNNNNNNNHNNHSNSNGTSNGNINSNGKGGSFTSKAAVGGVLQPIALRIFLDHSMLEVFTSTGQVLTTRVYHHESENHPNDDGSHAAASTALELASFGVESGVSNVAGHMLEPIWHEDAGLGDLELRAKKNYGEFVKAKAPGAAGN